MTRSVPEWIGKTPDQKVPDRVKVRIFDREGGVCHISCRDEKEEVMDDATLIPDEAKGYESLGPAYFAARRVVDAAVQDFQDKELEPLVKASVDAFYSKLQDAVETSLWSDAEMNLQGKMWHMVDETVKALLTGEKWALERYCLGSRYEHEKVRAAVAAHIPQELQDKRVADLEAQVLQLSKDLSWAR